MENIQSYSVSIRNDFRRVRAHCGNAEGPEGTSVKKEVVETGHPIDPSISTKRLQPIKTQIQGV